MSASVFIDMAAYVYVPKPFDPSYAPSYLVNYTEIIIYIFSTNYNRLLLLNIPRYLNFTLQ